MKDRIREIPETQPSQNRKFDPFFLSKSNINCKKLTKIQVNIDEGETMETQLSRSEFELLNWGQGREDKTKDINERNGD